MPRTHITTVINGDETEFLTEDSRELKKDAEPAIAVPAPSLLMTGLIVHV